MSSSAASTRLRRGLLVASLSVDDIYRVESTSSFNSGMQVVPGLSLISPDPLSVIVD